MTVQLGLFHSPMDIRLVVKKVVWVILRELIMCIMDIIATLTNLMLSTVSKIKCYIVTEGLLFLMEIILRCHMRALANGMDITL